MDNLFVIIPAKPFAESKTRLSSILSVDERVRLSRALLWRTVNLAIQVGQVVVISRDTATRRLAKQAGAWSLVESGTTLNAAVRQALEWVLTRRGQAALILPADLPWLSLAHLEQMIHLGQDSPSVVIAPCRRTEGTNALLLHPPHLIDVHFGPGSFAEHQQAVRQIGLQPRVYHSAALALDIDLPEDLALWQGMPSLV
ncbi:MAG TPA: 2-phospho-L-lactate guanylyltransferase [Anaerolineae bacterium]|nr:2-phospho-L-lactate guanylyltransferase [Anaerolineae bacterium]